MITQDISKHKTLQDTFSIELNTITPFLCDVNIIFCTSPHVITFFFFFFFKTQLYIPSRKAVYVVEHVEKRTKHVGKKEKHSKTKKKNCQQLDSNLDHQKCRESVKGRQSRSAIKWPPPC